MLFTLKNDADDSFSWYGEVREMYLKDSRFLIQWEEFPRKYTQDCKYIFW